MRVINQVNGTFTGQPGRLQSKCADLLCTTLETFQQLPNTKLNPQMQVVFPWSARSMALPPPSSWQAQSSFLPLEGLLLPLHRILFSIRRAHIVIFLTHPTLICSILSQRSELFLHVCHSLQCGFF